MRNRTPRPTSLVEKFKFITVLTLMSGLASACAHHDTKEDAEHHHHDQKQAKFDGKCAYSVSHNEMNVDGKKEYSFEHAGMTYYFSSEEKKNLFKKDLDANLKNASRNWESRGGRY